MPEPTDKIKHYGYLFWLNSPDKTELSKKWYTDVSGDIFFCDGYNRQGVYIIPLKKLVVVRMGVLVIEGIGFGKKRVGGGANF
jgi:CubicO group peptidase (beta-lactamase class C family)